MPVRFGPFQLTHRLETGGMAETFTAIRQGPGKFEQHLCVKRILPSLQNDPEFVREFLNEAQLAAQLRHANIVQVVDFGEVDGEGHYLALELVDGIDLRELLSLSRSENAPIPLEIAVFITAQLASALEFAHQPSGSRAAVIHRDISSSNVLLSRDGGVYLSDFGIARAMGSRRRTRTGIRRGKTPYLAPEYLARGVFDERSDLYALGVLFFDLVCGKRPFDGANDAETFRNIREGHRADVRALRSDASATIVTVIDRLLARDPNERFTDAAALMDALTPILPTLNTKRTLGKWVARYADQSRKATPVENTNYAERYRSGRFPSRTASGERTRSESGSGRSGSSNRRLARFGDATDQDIRFVIEQRLGGGSFGEVYRVFDRERKTTVALKTLRALGPNALYRFKREFRALADISHPNLISFHELFQGESGWFFTMDHVAGNELLDHLKGPTTPQVLTDDISMDATLDAGPAPPSQTNTATIEYERIRETFAQMVRGLLALHQAGMVHRDLKPSNVMVDRVTQRVRILDFGLVTDVAIENRSQVIAGTPDYMAPEQAAGRDVSPATDFYAVGVMLYEALTGTLPYDGPPLKVMLQKQSEAAPDPRAIIPGLNEELATLCTELLALNPDARPTGRAVLQRLGNTATGEAEILASLQPPLPFVGRKKELLTLHTAWETHTSHTPLILRIEAPSGFGKSALADAFLTRFQERDATATVLVGRCYEQESVAFKAFDGLIDALSRHLEHLPEREAGLLMPRRLDALVRLFPALARVPIVKTALGQSAHAATQAHVALDVLTADALRELLERMSHHGPVMLCIDDVQWADEDSALLLSQLLLRPMPPAVTYVLTSRTKSEDSPVIRTLAELESDSSYHFATSTLQLRGMNAEDAMAFVRSAHPDLSAEALTKAIYEAQGHPMLLRELTRSDAMLNLFGEHPSLLDIFQHRIGKLPPDPRTLLELIALAGRPLPFEALYNLQLGSDAIAEHLTSLRTLSFIRVEHGRALPFHDRIRETIEKYLEEDLRKGRHQTLARALESQVACDDEMLAYHWHLAGETSHAATFALRAAHEAHSSCAFVQAIKLYSQALESSQFSDAERSQTLAELAECAQRSGRLVDASRHYEKAAEYAEGQRRYQLMIEAGKTLIGLGNFRRGIEIVKASIGQNGIRWPSLTRAFANIARLLWWANIGKPPNLNGRQWSTEPSDEKQNELRAHWSSALACIAHDNPRYLSFIAEYAAAANRSKSRHHATLAACFLGHIFGAFNRVELAEQTFAIAEANIVDDTPGSEELRATLHYFRGLSLGYQMRAAEANAPLQALVGRIEKGGSANPIFRFPLYLTWLVIQMFLGEWHVVRDQLPRLIHDAKARGDLLSWYGLQLLGNALLAIQNDDRDHATRTYESTHDLRAGLDIIAVDKASFANQGVIFSLGENFLYERNADRLWELAQAHHHIIYRQGTFLLPNIRTTWGSLRARTALMLAKQNPSNRRLWIKRAKREIRRFSKVNSLMPRGLALSLQACVCVSEGNVERACTQFKESITLFETGRFMLFAASAKWQLAELLTGEEALRYRAEAMALMEERGLAAPEHYPGSVFPLPYPPQLATETSTTEVPRVR